jgi:GTP cyclohydrolase II
LLLTNNPAKLAGLADTGIEVCGRIPLHAPVTASNRGLLERMAARAGHRSITNVAEPGLPEGSLKS